MFENGVQEFSFIVRSNINRSILNSDTSHLLQIKDTFAIFSFVRIVLFSCNSSNISEVLESLRGESSITSVVVKIASTVYELLFTQVSELVVLNLVVRLHTSNS